MFILKKQQRQQKEKKEPNPVSAQFRLESILKPSQFDVRVHFEIINFDKWPGIKSKTKNEVTLLSTP